LKKIIFIFSLLVVCIGMYSKEYLDINFFIEPRFEPIEMNMVNFLVKNIKNDSIDQFNVFAGRILNSAQNDSLTLHFLNSIEPDLACPTDYLLYERNVNFNLLNSNVNSDSVTILDRFVIDSDSMSIGFLSAYIPDWAVKNDIASHAEFKYNIFEIVKQISTDLTLRADFIVLLSNMGKYIDSDLVQNLPIDVVVSFDYKKKKNGSLNRGKTSFYSVLTNKGNFGKLQLAYQKGEVYHNWDEVEFKVGD